MSIVEILDEMQVIKNSISTFNTKISAENRISNLDTFDFRVIKNRYTNIVDMIFEFVKNNRTFDISSLLIEKETIYSDIKYIENIIQSRNFEFKFHISTLLKEITENRHSPQIDNFLNTINCYHGFISE